MPASLSAVAKRFDFVRETEGPNRGYFVAYFLRYTNTEEGQPWCAAFLSKVLDIAYKGKSPLIKSASTVVLLSLARQKGWVVQTPQVDDLYFFIRDDGTAHHVGAISGVSPSRGIAGNTSSDGLSSNGDGVYDHELNVLPKSIVFVRLPSQ